MPRRGMFYEANRKIKPRQVTGKSFYYLDNKRTAKVRKSFYSTKP